ncbi:hypothetical protein AQF52_5216 [Streptomyces venezuelae]|uniref:DUF4232 domain-containing protein n=1 Tax=Streptomyces gardneri TaxID=66892 RepID=UPI0006BC737A|nr:DUF4232 domain-containing protein [Streptomyces gardneri]ALO10810.1 hypothetical protein AQF52_5216 [Streptomyces venezuelae]WRK39223.1 DUF4232 domain-containing protein [Streptomyces venezuelae]CUM38701.1 hypothetical protein BN2537_6367 [Streptomyces venezuelae]
MRTTMRTHHKATVLAAAAVTALSLGLTACGGDSGTGAKDAGSASSSHSEQAAGAADTGTGDDTADDTADGTSDAADTADGSTAGGPASGGVSEASATGGKGSTSGKGSTGGKTAAKTSTKTAAKAPACAYGDIGITAAKADEVPTEHITLTATNVSGRSCTLLQYPLIAFGDIQTAKDVPAVAKSKPAAPVVLKPGAPAYANVRVALGGVGEGNKVVKSFNVNLFAADGPAEGSIVVKAPAGGLAVDETAAKTGYWTYELRNGADEF